MLWCYWSEMKTPALQGEKSETKTTKLPDGHDQAGQSNSTKRATVGIANPKQKTRAGLCVVLSCCCTLFWSTRNCLHTHTAAAKASLVAAGQQQATVQRHHNRCQGRHHPREGVCLQGADCQVILLYHATTVSPVLSSAPVICNRKPPQL